MNPHGKALQQYSKTTEVRRLRNANKVRDTESPTSIITLSAKGEGLWNMPVVSSHTQGQLCFERLIGHALAITSLKTPGKADFYRKKSEALRERSKEDTSFRAAGDVIHMCESVLLGWMMIGTFYVTDIRVTTRI